MTQVTAAEFQRKFGEFQHRAQREPVEITRHGRRELVLMSANHYDWLKAVARRAHKTTEAFDVAIEAAERESARHLAQLGGAEPDLAVPPRQRSAPA